MPNTEFLRSAERWVKDTLASLSRDLPGVPRYERAVRQYWDAALCAQNYVALSWPEELGGRALSIGDVIAFHRMCAEHKAPQPINSIAHSILAPTLLRFGTESQKCLLLNGIRTGTEIWCQGYSEPGSGSDLASVRTRAVRTAEGYRVTGHKIWTTQAHVAHWCFALVRTDAQSTGHSGLSFLLLDMRAPGVQVSPIRQMTGESDFNEVLFDNVLVPFDNLLGAEGEGWKIAMAAAEFERGVYFLPRVIQLSHELETASALLNEAASNRARDPGLLYRLNELRDLCRVIELRVESIGERVQAGQTPGTDGAVLKLLWSEVRQRVIELQADLADERALVGPSAGGRYARWAEIVRELLWSRAETIVAGTSEIQRNIIAERVLGLPKDQRGRAKS